jgi:hypothetical protein
MTGANGCSPGVTLRKQGKSEAFLCRLFRPREFR